MNRKENDPDTLQLRDEMDPEWVDLWHKATTKKKPTKKQVTSIVNPPKTQSRQNSQLQSKKT
jgi:hypothetical protein